MIYDYIILLWDDDYMIDSYGLDHDSPQGPFKLNAVIFAWNGAMRTAWISYSWWFPQTTVVS